ncbi:MAG: glycosyltransferase family 2 protein [Casimicrobium sp.]
MKISVITAVYNNAGTIAQALESTLSQNYPNVELIVIDGGSTDGTQDVIARYRDRIATYVSEKDRGIYDALNKGVRMATGDVVGFLHSDDLFADREVLMRVASAMADDSVDACYGDLRYVRKEDTNSIVRHWRAGEFSRSKLARGWMPPHPTFYVKRPIYLGEEAFNTNYRIAADYDCMLKILRRSRNILYIPHVQVLMRVGGASNRSLKNIMRKSREDFRALRANGFSHVGAGFALFGKNVSKLPQFFAR